MTDTSTKSQFSKGTKVQVYWPDDDTYYPGTITQCHSNDNHDDDDDDDGDKNNKLTVQYDSSVDEAQPETLARNRIYLVNDDTVLKHKAQKKNLVTDKVEINSRVSIYWPSEKQSYEGCVSDTRYDRSKGFQKYMITYDDGEEEWRNLLECKFQLLEDKQDGTKQSKKGKSSSRRDISEDNELIGDQDEDFEMKKSDKKKKAKTSRNSLTKKQKKRRVSKKISIDAASDDDQDMDSAPIVHAGKSKTNGTDSKKTKKRKSDTIPNTSGTMDKFLQNGASEQEDDNSNNSPTSQTVAAKPKSNSTRPSRKRKMITDYFEAFDEEHEDFEPKKSSAKKKRGLKRSTYAGSDSDFGMDDAESSNEDDDAFLDDECVNEENIISDESIHDDFASDSDEKPTKPKKRTASKKGSIGKGKGKTTTKKADTKSKATGDKTGKKSMAESFTPINLPQYARLSSKEIQNSKKYLDACGMEATDDIIGMMVGIQVEKIAKLLERALSNGQQLANGSQQNMLKLGTACSGTDAPSLAMGMIQEQLGMRGLTNLFHFDHLYSCENEPFKQSYLARNFDSVLYPDIGKLTVDKPRDVYGRQIDLPDINCFIAGTSCKDFSMLKSSHRLDIEDKGTSGETFLAAVEVLFQQKPQWALFENVEKAPWEKMKEYITGRINLSSYKKGAKKKTVGSKKNTGFDHFKFKRNDRNEIIVFQTAQDIGIRPDSVLSGYICEGDADEKIITAEWPKSVKKTGECTLTELIAANNDMDWSILCFRTPVTYCCHYVKVDSKKYGIPQTRNRIYMFVWQPENNDIKDDLGHYFQSVVEHLQYPAKHCLEAFLLEVDHDNIRNFREALRGPPGRETKRQVDQMGDFFSSSSANLKHNTICRDLSGMKKLARPITEWKPYGGRHIPYHYWLEYFNMQHQRETDMVDILHLSGIRDAESHDSNHSSFSWNLSQNVSKEKHRDATPGTSSCITPGGDHFLPHLGRPILGCEKLLLQGIPYFLLSLGNETEVQLSDLAGNAMTLNVVSATIIAALTCKQLQQEAKKKKNIVSEKDRKSICDKIFNSSRLDRHVKSKITLLPELECTNATDINMLFKDLAKLSTKAVHTSIWCTCETSGQNTSATQFLQCTTSRISCCGNCLQSHSGYAFDSESYDVVKHTIESVKTRDLSNFENELRTVLPSNIFFKESTFDALKEKGHRFQVRERQAFSLHRIRRFRRYWAVVYFARDELDQPIAELTIRIGEVSTQMLDEDEVTRKIQNNGADRDDADGKVDQYGVFATLKSFLPARVEPYEYGTLDPSAKLQVLLSSNIETDDSETSMSHDDEWLILDKDQIKIELKVEGAEPIDSYRVRLGVEDSAKESIHTSVSQHKQKVIQQMRENPKEKRRFYYPSNWKKWPTVINITHVGDNKEFSDEEKERIVLLEGEYISRKCKHVVPHDALWVRKGCDGMPTLYLIFKPDVVRTGPDVAIITTSLSYEDTTHILAYLPLHWQPSDSLMSNTMLVKSIFCPKWSCVSSSNIEGLIPRSSVEVGKPESKYFNSNSSNILEVRGLKEVEVEMLSRGFDTDDLDENGVIHLHLQHSVKAQYSLRAFNSICAASILKYAASTDLKEQLSVSAAWINLTRDGVVFGQCEKTIPNRPKEEWFYDEERLLWDRRGQPDASREYCKALENAPQVFDFQLMKQEGILSLGINPEVAAHNAARYIIEGREQEVQNNLIVEYRLSSLQGQQDPSHDRYVVKSCQKETPMDVKLHSGHKLYERQQKVVSKMFQIEERKTEYTEVEMSQHLMPGSVEWSVVARASRKSNIRGGVICDAIGAGKTVVSIALILNGIENAKKGYERPNKSKASLIVVPDGLIGQWESEIKKFSNLSVVCICDTKGLREITLRQILHADCVICPIDILESDHYMWHLDGMSKGLYRKTLLTSKTKSSEGKDALPQLPRNDGQKEKSGVRGVWLSAASNNPYGSGVTPKSQAYRNQSARYSHVYQEKIDALRHQKFTDNQKGVPIEYFEWERIFVDEIHESLITKEEVNDEKKTRDINEKRGFFSEKNRRAGREFLGLMTKDIGKRPLRFRKGIFGLTGTPLLDNSDRVIELANLMGICYVLGLSSHWRKLEKESSRDIFLHNYLEPKKSREIRDNGYKCCQAFLDTACCRNKADEQMKGIEKVEKSVSINMTAEEKISYLKSQRGVPSNHQTFEIGVSDFDPGAGHDVSVFLRENAKLPSRGKALVDLCRDILKKDSTTKIIIFADGSVGGGVAARDFLNEHDDLKCTWLKNEDSVREKNKKISWYQTPDATVEDKKRPRMLVLNFEHAAGLNLQHECYNVILFNPLYYGEGLSTGNAVNDTSTELQAIGRVYRPGQPKQKVYVHRLEVRGPDGEDCLDGQLIRRNTDKDTIEAAINSSD